MTLAERLAVEAAHIGQHEDGDLLVDELVHRIGHAAAALADLRIGCERPLDVVERRQERLRLIGGAAEDEPDAAALAALVEQVHRAGRAFAEDLDAGDGVADFGRQVEARPSVSVAFALEGEAHVGERQVLEVEGAHRAGIAPVRFGAHEP